MTTLSTNFQQVKNEYLNLHRWFNESNKNILPSEEKILAEKCKKYAVLHEKILEINVFEQSITNKIGGWKKDKMSSNSPFSCIIDDKTKAVLIRKAKLAKMASKAMRVIGVVLALMGFVISVASLLNRSPSICKGHSGSDRFFDSTSRFFGSFEINRKKRLYTSQNFQQFVNCYIVDKNKFVPTERDLLDCQLHQIYMEWKQNAKAILA